MNLPLEKSDPETFADFFVEYAADPECNISELSRRCGISKQLGRLIAQRMETRYQQLKGGVERATTKSLVKGLEEALPLVLAQLKDKDLIEKSSYRELATGFGIMVEKRQLLLGEPTQIMSLEERRNLNEIAPEIVAEIEKRSLKPVDVEYEDIPRDGPVPAVALSRTAKKQAKREDRGRV